MHHFSRKSLIRFISIILCCAMLTGAAPAAAFAAEDQSETVVAATPIDENDGTPAGETNGEAPADGGDDATDRTGTGPSGADNDGGDANADGTADQPSDDDADTDGKNADEGIAPAALTFTAADGYLLYLYHDDCAKYFAVTAAGGLEALTGENGDALVFPEEAGGLAWHFEAGADDAYTVWSETDGLRSYLYITADGDLYVGAQPGAIRLQAQDDGFYLSDNDGLYYLAIGYDQGHTLLVVNSKDAASLFHTQAARLAPPQTQLVEALLPAADFKAVVVRPDQVYANTLAVLFVRSADGYRALKVDGSVSGLLNTQNGVAEGRTITSPDTDVLWSLTSREGDRPTDRDDKQPPALRYIRSAVEIDGNYLAAISENVLLSTRNSASNLKLVNNADGLSVRLITEDDDRCIAFDGSRFYVSQDMAAAADFYFATLQQDYLQASEGPTAAVPEGALFKIIPWGEVQPDSGAKYMLVNAAEYNYQHYAVAGNGRLSSSPLVNVNNDWDCVLPLADGTVRGVEPCAFSAGEYLHTLEGDTVLWTVARGADGFVFQNVDTGLFLAPNTGYNSMQTVSLSTAAVDVTVTADGDLLYLSCGDRYLDIWKYVVGASDSVGNDRHTADHAFFIAQLVEEDLVLSTHIPAADGDDSVYFGGANSLWQGSQHAIGGGDWEFGVGAGAYVMMHPEAAESDFVPADGRSNYDITFCADEDADMPLNISQPVKYLRVSIDDDPYGLYTDAQRAALKAMVPKTYPYTSLNGMLQAMRDAGVPISEHCGPDEIIAGFQAAIYTVTDPLDDGEVWGYVDSNYDHTNYEVNRSVQYVSDADIAAGDIAAVRDYLLGFAAMAQLTEGVLPMSALTLQPLKVEAGVQYFALTFEYNGATYALDYRVNETILARPFLAEDTGNPCQWWYVDNAGYIRTYLTEYTGSNSHPHLCMIFTHDYYNGQGNTQFTFSIREDGKAPLNGYSFSDSDCIHIYAAVIYDAGRLAAPGYVVPDPINFANADLYDYVINYSDGNPRVTWYIQADSADATFHPTMSAAEATVFGQAPLTFPVAPQPYELIDYTALSTENGDTYTVTVTGTLNQPVRANDTVSVWLYYDFDNQQRMEVATDATTFTFTMSDIPADLEYTFAISYIMPYYDVYLYYPTSPSPEDEGWNEYHYQAQIGGEFAVSYAEVFHNSRTIPVEKRWQDNNIDHDPVDLDLVDARGNVVKTITLQGDDWTGAFAHVPYQSWTYRSYPLFDNSNHPLRDNSYPPFDPNFKPDEMVVDTNYIIGQNELGMILLSTQQYTVAEQAVDGYTATFQSPTVRTQALETPNEGDSGLLTFTASTPNATYPYAFTATPSSIGENVSVYWDIVELPVDPVQGKLYLANNQRITVDEGGALRNHLGAHLAAVRTSVYDPYNLCWLDDAGLQGDDVYPITLQNGQLVADVADQRLYVQLAGTYSVQDASSYSRMYFQLTSAASDATAFTLVSYEEDGWVVTNAPTPTPKDRQRPDTGDNSPWETWLSLLVICFVGAILCWLAGRRRPVDPADR